MAGGMKTMYTLLEANKTLSDGKITNTQVNIPRILHRLELFVTDDNPKGSRKAIIRWLRRTRRKYERYL
jgi:hypothetical protein